MIGKRKSVGTTHPRTRAFNLGLCLYLGVALVLVLLAVKPQISSQLRSGETMQLEFQDRFKLRKYDSTIKMSGIEVGSVIDVERTDAGLTRVTVKMDEDVREKLGSAPTARIEPRTLLGGRYAIELHPGGRPGTFKDDLIPVSRTAAPVEADAVLEALPASALDNVQSLVPELEGTLRKSDGAVDRLVRDVPPILDEAHPLVNALRGTRPQSDLPLLVTNLSAIARTLNAQDGQLDRIVSSLDRTAAVLAAQRGPLSETVAELPATLRSTRTGLAGLTVTVDELTETAEALEPTAPELADLITKLTPTLKEARPVLRDLLPLLRDAEPAVRQLVPVAERATGVLEDLEGPVLDRVNGPVLDFVLNPWHGKGFYSESGYGSQKDHKVYEELAYMVTNIDRASMTQDRHGATLGFQVGAATNSIDGLPFSLDNLLKLALQHAGGAR